jgi:hypothetical protein
MSKAKIIAALQANGLNKEQAKFIVSGREKFSRFHCGNCEDPLVEAIRIAKKPSLSSKGICVFDLEGQPVIFPDNLLQLESMLESRIAMDHINKVLDENKRRPS